jgi:hypothetical protein
MFYQFSLTLLCALTLVSLACAPFAAAAALRALSD